MHDLLLPWRNFRLRYLFWKEVLTCGPRDWVKKLAQRIQALSTSHGKTEEQRDRWRITSTSHECMLGMHVHGKWDLGGS